ncbi:hypothetical protein BD311DRAFT_824526 [Dichomitus squalens]|uniref:Fungal-type protein kinase domain-containing protein n=1 Tax=Dichomitus squalens TaxID=114155 RepID=A0A4V2JYT3_9APHY|nr:hypothetical protein BD311DRAFT_824526 [Dichomitus squalens]
MCSSFVCRRDNLTICAITRSTKLIRKYNKAAHSIAPMYSPFMQANAAFSVGLDIEIEGNDDEDDATDPRSCRRNSYHRAGNEGSGIGYGWDISSHHVACEHMLRVMPNLKSDLDYLLRDPDRVNSRVRARRRDDCGKFRDEVLNLMRHIPEFAHLNIVHIEKAERGWKNDLTARLLCPMQLIPRFDRDPTQFRADVRNAKTEIHCDDFFSALYDTDMHDPEDFQSGLFRGPLLLKTFEWLFCGRKVARGTLQFGEKASGKEPFLAAYKITQVTPQMIAYAACILQFALNSQSEWSRKDGNFDVTGFHTNVAMSFILDEWADDTLAWWDKWRFLDQRRVRPVQPLSSLVLAQAPWRHSLPIRLLLKHPPDKMRTNSQPVVQYGIGIGIYVEDSSSAWPLVFFV